MTITITTTADPHAFARFTWSDDGDECEITALGFDDETIDRMIAAKAHEGADLEGFNVSIDL